jgi:acyl carrier protein
MAGAAAVQSRVQRCLDRAIAELNAIRAPSERLSSDSAEILLGDSGALDSLAFVNLVVALDTALAEEFDPGTSVMAELLAAPDPAEFATVGALVAFVAGRIGSGTE